jgi:Tol biopolymer transport system component
MLRNPRQTSGCRLVVLLFVAGCAGRLHAEDADGKGLYRVNADGTEHRLLVPMGEDSAMTSPQQSPDGKYIAYDTSAVFNSAGQPDLEYDHVLVVSSDGGEPRDLGVGMLPGWSPDSKQICFSVAPGARGDKPSLYVMNADGSGRQRLFEADAGRWSPDGGRIAYFVDGEVGVYDVLTEKPIRLTGEARNITGAPAWSPDGTKIAIVYFSDADHTLAVLEADKELQQPRVLWEGHGISRSASWAPSRRIVVCATPNKVLDIYSLDAGEKPSIERPFQGKVPFTPKDPAWCSDGRGLILIKPK